MKITITNLTFLDKYLLFFLSHTISFIYQLQYNPFELYKQLCCILDLLFFLSIFVIIVFCIMQCVKQLILLN